MEISKLLYLSFPCNKTDEYQARLKRLRRRGNVICVPRSFFEQPKLIREVDPTYRLQPER